MGGSIRPVEKQTTLQTIMNPESLKKSMAISLKPIHFTERFMQGKNPSKVVAISWKRVSVDLSYDRLSF